MDFNNNWSSGAVELRVLDGANALYFTTNDFIINSADIVDKARVEADFRFGELDFGIIMKYNESGFLLYSLNGSYALLSKILPDKDGNLFAYSIKGTPCRVEKNTDNTLAVVMTKDSYQFFLNNTPIMSAKLADNTFQTGKSGIYSKTGNYCKEFRISTMIPSGWQFEDPDDMFIGTLGDGV
jgi:hypothetical protein